MTTLTAADLEKAAKLSPCDCEFGRPMGEHLAGCIARRAAIAAALAEEREACAKAICTQCAANRPLTEDGSWHTAKEGGGILLPVGPCQAAAIRARGK